MKPTAPRTTSGRRFQTLDKDLGRFTHAEIAQKHAFRPVWRLGLMLLILIAGLILFVGLSGRDTRLIGLGAGLIVAAWLGLSIGANDVANSLGPAVGAGAIGLVPGLIMVAIAEVAGASLAGGPVTERLATGIFDPSLIATGPRTQMVMLAALMGAATWITLATGIGLPISTSHSIVGGLAGAGIASVGWSAVKWQGLGAIATVWVVSPIIAGTLAGLLLVFLRARILLAEDRNAAALRWLPLLVGTMTGLFAGYLAVLAHQPRFVASLAVIAAGAATTGWMMWRISKQLGGLDEKGSIRRLFRPPLLVAAIMMGFAHGANDVGNVAGPLTVILRAQTMDTQIDASGLAILVAALAIALGALFFGGRLVRMVGSGITRLNAVRAFCVSLATAATVLLASALGLPVSTTHIAVGGIYGVGFAREWLERREMRQRRVRLSVALPAEETRRRLLIRRSHVATITAAWMVTVPITAALGAAACYLILWVTGA